MKVFDINIIEDDLINCKSPSDIEEIYKLINEEEDFIVTYKELDSQMSKLIIATNIGGKLKTGEFKLFSENKLK